MHSPCAYTFLLWLKCTNVGASNMNTVDCIWACAPFELIHPCWELESCSSGYVLVRARLNSVMVYAILKIHLSWKSKYVKVGCTKNMAFAFITNLEFKHFCVFPWIQGHKGENKGISNWLSYFSSSFLYLHKTGLFNTDILKISTINTLQESSEINSMVFFKRPNHYMPWDF